MPYIYKLAENFIGQTKLFLYILIKERVGLIENFTLSELAVKMKKLRIYVIPAYYFSFFYSLRHVIKLRYI